ncbi:hypothetical protein PHYPSEUDO_000407 [Phytophthora pseudosyringae]|uniref:Apple domain-containing protein n=1 Tax=Phytophthora pseudosyringae TaxID=221518 RepID=A0A8T1V2W9_9STRA|nr:hypothetical protein PHYPSEUDO_000407 [Phytophthora pseudosyringae]
MLRVNRRSVRRQLSRPGDELLRLRLLPAVERGLLPNQETDIDYYGNDCQTIYGVQLYVCCEKCVTTSGCAAYTFVNENPDSKTAYYLETWASTSTSTIWV